MMQRTIFRQGCLCILALFLFNCAGNCRKWFLEEEITACPQYNSGKLYLPAEEICRGLELEIVRSASGMRMYLNTFSLPFSPDNSNPNLSPFFITIACDEPALFLGELLEGGQRVLLPIEVSQQIVSALLDNQSVVIKAGRYQTEIVPTSFAKLYDDLLQIPIPE
jgi:hypothetical protein